MLTDQSRKRDIETVKKEKAMELAFGEAMKFGFLGLVSVGSATALATKFNPMFKMYMSVSAKTSLPVMAGLFLFTLKFEHTLSDAQRNPEKWGLGNTSIIEGKMTRMPIHHQLMNYMYDHPYYIIAGLGIPFAGKILHSQLQLKHIKFSQRIMHSRVFAQAGVISILLSTMAFKEYMDKHGRFPEPNA